MTAVQLNGEIHVLAEGACLADAVAVVTDAASGIAVALDDTVVPRSEWASTPLADGSRVEVLTAVQGG